MLFSHLTVAASCLAGMASALPFSLNTAKAVSDADREVHTGSILSNQTLENSVSRGISVDEDSVTSKQDGSITSAVIRLSGSVVYPASKAIKVAEAAGSGLSSNLRDLVARRVIVIVNPDDGHMPPVWIAITVISSILAFGSIVGCIFFCCFHHKHARNTKHINEERRERAEKVLNELPIPASEAEGGRAATERDVEGQNASNSRTPA